MNQCRKDLDLQRLHGPLVWFHFVSHYSIALSVICNIVSVRRSHALTLSLLFYSSSFFPPLVWCFVHSYWCLPFIQLRQTNPSVFYLPLSAFFPPLVWCFIPILSLKTNQPICLLFTSFCMLLNIYIYTSLSKVNMFYHFCFNFKLVNRDGEESMYLSKTII